MQGKEISWGQFINGNMTVICRVLTEAKDFLDKCIEQGIIGINEKRNFLESFDYNTCYFMLEGNLHSKTASCKYVYWDNVISEKNEDVSLNNYKLRIKNKNNDIYTFICYAGVDDLGKHKIMLYDDFGGIWIAPIDDLMVVT